jgi:hypothetical protein
MRRHEIFIILLSVLGTGSAAAQTTSGPSPTTGTTPTTGGSVTRPLDLDLPLERPVCVSPTPAPPVPVTPDDGEDDPRDEPPPVIYGEEIDSENDTIFYVLDRSGSMYADANTAYTGLDGNRTRGSRLDRAKVELARSILGLSRNFKFNILAYDCGYVIWSRELREATDSNKQAALGWVGGLEATGATATGPACAVALSDRQNMSLVLLTDGDPNCGVPEFYEAMNGFAGDYEIINGHRRMIRNANAQHATINVFGIAAYGTFRRFCQEVASDSGGSYFDVP